MGIEKISALSSAAMKDPTITELLRDWTGGDPQALNQLAPRVQRELRKMAARHMNRESSGHTLQATALVNEAYLHLIDQRSVRWQNRAHFFGIASQIMRRILLDHARRRHAKKRGGGELAFSFDENIGVALERDRDLIALDDALGLLAELDPRQARVVELRIFGGLSHDEAAVVLDLSKATIKREWSTALAFLRREMRRGAR